MTTYQETRTLDVLKKRGRAGTVEPITLRRGESGTKITALVRNDGAVFPLTGYTAKFCAVNAAGDFVRRDATVEAAAAGTVSYTLTTDLTAVDGPVSVAYFELTKSGEVATTDTIPLIVLPNMDLSPEEAQEYQTKVDALVSAMEEELAASTAATTSATAAAQAARQAAALSEGVQEYEDRISYLEAEVLKCRRRDAKDTGQWTYYDGKLIAPTADALVVTGTKARIAGTVTGTKLYLTSFTPPADQAHAELQEALEATQADLDAAEASLATAQADLDAAEARVAELESCCDGVNAALTDTYRRIAALSGAWQYYDGKLISPSSAKFSVTGTKARIKGTVSGTKLVLS